MPPLPVVKDLDVVDQAALSLVARLVPLMEDAFRLQRRKEAFHGGVIVAVAVPAHAADGLMLGKHLRVRAGAILAAAVRVAQKATAFF